MDINYDYSGQYIGKYQLIKKLGNGSFGAVYKVHDRVLDVDKALKILEVSDPKRAYKLFSEAAIPYKCQHINIVRINGADVVTFENNLQFIVDMQLINGGSLEDLLADKHISVIDGLKMMKDILFGIEFSHLQGIIHRDIKPANILIDNDIPKISDFGLSTALNSLIIPWEWYCTHAAPETFKISKATVATDIFALGMTLYRVVNNISDWRTFISSIPNSKSLIVSGKLIKILPFKPYVPKTVEKVIKRACDADPDKRYHSASDMRNSLEKLKYQFDWHQIDSWHWIGNLEHKPQKDISLDVKKRSVEVIVKNNNRKSSYDSKIFSDRFEGERYFMDYIVSSTLR